MYKYKSSVIKDFTRQEFYFHSSKLRTSGEKGDGQTQQNGNIKGVKKNKFDLFRPRTWFLGDCNETTVKTPELGRIDKQFRRPQHKGTNQTSLKKKKNVFLHRILKKNVFNPLIGAVLPGVKNSVEISHLSDFRSHSGFLIEETSCNKDNNSGICSEVPKQFRYNVTMPQHVERDIVYLNLFKNLLQKKKKQMSHCDTSPKLIGITKMFLYDLLLKKIVDAKIGHLMPNLNDSKMSNLYDVRSRQQNYSFDSSPLEKKAVLEDNEFFDLSSPRFKKDIFGEFIEQDNTGKLEHFLPNNSTECKHSSEPIECERDEKEKESQECVQQLAKNDLIALTQNFRENSEPYEESKLKEPTPIQGISNKVNFSSISLSTERLASNSEKIKSIDNILKEGESDKYFRKETNLNKEKVNNPSALNTLKQEKPVQLGIEQIKKDDKKPKKANTNVLNKPKSNTVLNSVFIEPKPEVANKFKNVQESKLFNRSLQNTNNQKQEHLLLKDLQHKTQQSGKKIVEPSNEGSKNLNNLKTKTTLVNQSDVAMKVAEDPQLEAFYCLKSKEADSSSILSDSIINEIKAKKNASKSLVDIEISSPNKEMPCVKDACRLGTEHFTENNTNRALESQEINESTVNLDSKRINTNLAVEETIGVNKNNQLNTPKTNIVSAKLVSFKSDEERGGYIEVKEKRLGEDRSVLINVNDVIEKENEARLNNKKKGQRKQNRDVSHFDKNNIDILNGTVKQATKTLTLDSIKHDSDQRRKISTIQPRRKKVSSKEIIKNQRELLTKYSGRKQKISDEQLRQKNDQIRSKVTQSKKLSLNLSSHNRIKPRNKKGKWTFVLPTKQKIKTIPSAVITDNSKNKSKTEISGSKTLSDGISELKKSIPPENIKDNTKNKSKTDILGFKTLREGISELKKSKIVEAHQNYQTQLKNIERVLRKNIRTQTKVRLLNKVTPVQVAKDTQSMKNRYKMIKAVNLQKNVSKDNTKNLIGRKQTINILTDTNSESNNKSTLDSTQRVNTAVNIPKTSRHNNTNEFNVNSSSQLNNNNKMSKTTNNPQKVNAIQDTDISKGLKILSNKQSNSKNMSDKNHQNTLDKYISNYKQESVAEIKNIKSGALKHSTNLKASADDVKNSLFSKKEKNVLLEKTTINKKEKDTNEKLVNISVETAESLKSVNTASNFNLERKNLQDIKSGDVLKENMKHKGQQTNINKNEISANKTSNISANVKKAINNNIATKYSKDKKVDNVLIGKNVNDETQKKVYENKVLDTDASKNLPQMKLSANDSRTKNIKNQQTNVSNQLQENSLNEKILKIKSQTISNYEKSSGRKIIEESDVSKNTATNKRNKKYENVLSNKLVKESGDNNITINKNQENTLKIITEGKSTQGTENKLDKIKLSQRDNKQEINSIGVQSEQSSLSYNESNGNVDCDQNVNLTNLETKANKNISEINFVNVTKQSPHKNNMVSRQNILHRPVQERPTKQNKTITKEVKPEEKKQNYNSLGNARFSTINKGSEKQKITFPEAKRTRENQAHLENKATPQRNLSSEGLKLMSTSKKEAVTFEKPTKPLDNNNLNKSVTNKGKVMLTQPVERPRSASIARGLDSVAPTRKVILNKNGVENMTQEKSTSTVKNTLKGTFLQKQQNSKHSTTLNNVKQVENLNNRPNSSYQKNVESIKQNKKAFNSDNSTSVTLKKNVIYQNDMKKPINPVKQMGKK